MGRRPAARERDTERSLRRAGLLHARGDLREAARLTELVVRAARRAGDELLLGRALNQLGVVCKELGQLRRAEGCYRRALPLLRRLLGPSHASMASLYHNLGGILYAQGAWARAERWTRRAVDVRRAELGRHHPDVMADEASLAPILAARGKTAPAEAIYRRAIRFYSTRAPAPYEVAVNASNLGVLLDEAGRHRAAESSFRRALAAYRSMRRPPPHDVGLALYNLGVLRARTGRADAAERVSEAHSLFLAALGPRHALTREAARRLLALRAACRQPARAARSAG